MTGAVAVRAQAGTRSYAVVDAGDAWQVLLYATASGTAVSEAGIRPAACTTIGVFSEAATGSIVVGDAGLFTGTLSAAQILAQGGVPLTTTAAASNPNAGAYSWSFDGSNDSLALGSVPFQMSDDHCVIAGFKCDNTTPTSSILSLSNSGLANPLIRLTISTGGIYGQWCDDAGTLVSFSGLSIANSEAAVVTMQSSSGLKKIRKNGIASATTSATVLGATTLNLATLGEGFLGTTAPVIIVKGTVTDAELLSIERLVGQIAGVTI